MFSFNQYLTELKLTLEYHSKLNPKIWHKGKLDPEDRKSMIEQAKDFVTYCGEDVDAIKDIVFTGSSANFNYTKFSDVDVHILVSKTNQTDDRLHKLKDQWTAAHPTLKIAGYPLELYIQSDHAHFPEGQGVFSLLKNGWLISPKHLDHIPVLEDPKTQVKVEHYISTIKRLTKSDSLSDIKEFKTKLHTMRTAGLEREGEFSIENVIYKELRNRGLIDKLNKHKKELKGTTSVNDKD